MPKRPARCYTKISSPPYTRKEYIHGVPVPEIRIFEMGNTKEKDKFKAWVYLYAIEPGNIRARSLEAARKAANYVLKSLGRNAYFLKICVYPHHVLRENKMMSGAGADRVQKGMRLAFGKPIETAAYIRKETLIIEAASHVENLGHLKEAIRRASHKIPLKTRMVVEIRK